MQELLVVVLLVAAGITAVSAGLALAGCIMIVARRRKRPRSPRVAERQG